MEARGSVGRACNIYVRDDNPVDCTLILAREVEKRQQILGLFIDGTVKNS